MAISSIGHLDLSSQEVVDFLCGYDVSMTTVVDDPGPDYRLAGVRDIPAPEDHLNAFAVVKKTYSVLEGGTPITDMVVWVPARHPVAVSYILNLFVAVALPVDRQQIIIDAFNRYQYPADGDIEDYADAIAAANGFTDDDFLIMMSFRIRKDGPAELFDDQEQKMISEVQKDERYRVALLSAECLRPSEVGPKEGDHIIDKPEAIDELIKTESELTGCYDLTVDKYEIGQAFYIPEFRTVTVCKIRRILCFRSRICVDHIETRDNRQIIWASVAYPSPQAAFKHIFEHCALTSAALSAVIGIVAENFALAVATFRIIFLECVRQHALEIADCLRADLFIVSDRTGWRPIW